MLRKAGVYAGFHSPSQRQFWAATEAVRTRAGGALGGVAGLTRTLCFKDCILGALAGPSSSPNDFLASTPCGPAASRRCHCLAWGCLARSSGDGLGAPPLGCAALVWWLTPSCLTHSGSATLLLPSAFTRGLTSSC